MTDITAGTEPVEPLVADTTAPDPIDTPAADQEAVATEEPPVLPINEYAGYRVPVKIAGEEQFVPLEEAVSGYMRQADATRKWQEAAELREQAEYGLNLARALEEDPSTTLAILQQLHRDVDVAAAEEELIDPQEKRLRQVETFIQAQEQQALEQRITAELDQYHDQLGLGQEEILQHAIEQGLGPDQLGLAARSLAFERQAAASAVAEAEAATAAQNAQIEQAKAQSAFVAGGASVNATATAPITDPKASFKDIALQVFREFGAA